MTTDNFGIFRIPNYNKKGELIGRSVFVQHPVFGENLSILNDVYFEANQLTMASPQNFRDLAVFLKDHEEDLSDIFPDKILVWKFNPTVVAPKFIGDSAYAEIF